MLCHRSLGRPSGRRVAVLFVYLVAFFAVISPALAQPAAPAAPPTPPAFTLSIPAGPLHQVLAAFTSSTGLTLEQSPALASLATLPSPGVSGTLTAEAALARLLEGTPLVAHRSAAGHYTIDIAVAAERVEVAGRAGPYQRELSSTGSRTMTALRDIPQTLTVVTRELLLDQSAQSVSEAVRNVPGVSAAQGEGNRDQLVLRGISTTSDFFVNGVRDDQERFRDLYNVESLEVLQGPAAVLFGRGGAGGIVNVVTRRAVPGTPSDASIEGGSDRHRRATTRLTVPAGQGAAFGLSAMAENSGGFRDGYFLRRHAISPTFTAPVGRAATLTLGGEYLEDHRRADRGVPSFAGTPAAVDPRQFFGSLRQNEAEGTVQSFAATLEARPGGRLLVRSHLLVGRYDRSYRNVYPASPVSTSGTLTLAAYSHDVDRTNVFSQTDLVYDVRIGPTAHVLLAGFEAGRQFQDETRDTAVSITGVGLAQSQRDADFSSAPRTVDRHAGADVLGLFVQDQIALSSRVKAVVGARVDRFGVQVDDRMPRSQDLSRTDTAISPRAGLIYQPAAPVSVYASYSYTFLPSGQTLGLAVNTAELRPETASNYELGTKIDVPRTRTTVSAAIFRLSRDHVRNQDPNDPSRLVLTGQQQTKGLVISASGNLTRAWKVQAGYAALDAVVTRDTSAAPAGRVVGLVPRRQVSLWTTYALPGRLEVGGGVVEQSRIFTSFTNQVRLPGFARLDGLVSFRHGHYRVALNAENLLNRRYYPTAHNDNNISPGAPRSVRVTVRASF